jgi:catechol 2,3-dioxygenase
MSVQAAHPTEPIRFGPRRLGHANLWVGDVNRNTDYYNKVFGLHLEATEPGILGSFLGNGNTHHDIGTVEITRGEDRLGRDGQILIPKEVSSQTGLFHLGWEMRTEGELVAAVERLRRTDHPVTMFADHQISHSIYVPDPDGNLHEFYADALRDWRSIFQGELDLVTGVWDPGKEPPANDIRYDPEPRLYGVDGAPLNPLRITHAAMIVGDLERSVRWFTDVAGLHLEYRDPQGTYANFSGTLGEHSIGLIQAAGESPCLHHISFQLQDENALEASKVELEARAVTIEKEVDNSTKHSLFLLDPDGIRWEFYVSRRPDHAAAAHSPQSERPYLI